MADFTSTTIAGPTIARHYVRSNNYLVRYWIVLILVRSLPVFVTTSILK